MAKSTSDTIWWTLFAAGGVVAALLVPALIFITGIALPFVNIGAFLNLHPVGYIKLYALASSVLGRAFFFVVISLSLFHCANRFFHTIKDLGVHGARGLMAFVFFGGAIAGTAVAGYLVCTL